MPCVTMPPAADFAALADPAEGVARHRVLVALRDGGAASRAQLARRTGLAPPTITAVVRRLLADRVVLDAGPVPPDLAGTPRSGPRGTRLALNPDLAFVLGIEVGFRTLRVLVCDAVGDVRATAQERLGLDHTPDEGLPVVGELCAEALREAGVEHGDVVAAGVALRGPIDSARQTVTDSGEVGGWAGVSAARIRRVVGAPVRLENDATLAALGEHTFGAGRGVRSSLTVKYHSGVGLGIIVDGTLVTGVHGGAGEIGHVPVDPHGPACRCGKRGCLDTVAAVPAILAAAEPRFGALDLPGLLALLVAGDVGIERLVRDSAALVGEAIATANLLLAPERIVVVGAMSRAGAAVIDPIRDAVWREALPGTRSRPDVVVGELGDRCTALGAAALALRESAWLPGSPVEVSSIAEAAVDRADAMVDGAAQIRRSR